MEKTFGLNDIGIFSAIENQSHVSGSILSPNTREERIDVAGIEPWPAARRVITITPWPLGHCLI